jgi:hypothetical protein
MRTNRMLIGSFIFLSLYTGALYAFASMTFVEPSTVIDPAGVPGSYSVHTLGFNSNGFLDTGSVALANSSTAQFYIGDDLFGGGDSGDGLLYDRAGQINGVTLGDLTNSGLGGNHATWIGYVEPGVTENSIRISPTELFAEATDDTLNNIAGLALTSTSASLGVLSGSTSTSLDISVAEGALIKGKDNLVTSQNFKLTNHANTELFKVMNDGSFLSQVGSMQLLNSSSVALSGIASVPISGSFFEDTTNQYINGMIDFTGLGGGIFPEMATLNKSTQDAFFVVVDGNSARMGFSAGLGSGTSHSLSFSTTGAEYSGIDDLSTTEGFRIENDSGTDLLSVYNNGTVLLPGTLTTTPVSGSNIPGLSLTLAGGKATGLGAGGSIVFQTSDASPPFTTLQSLSTKLTLLASGNLVLASRDRANGSAGPVLEIGRNTNATNSGAGSVNFLSKDGTNGYVWQDAAGNMRINTVTPSNANDTAGTIIGAQTSTRDTKQDITDFTDYAGALQKIVDAPLHTFRYIKEVEGYGADSPLAKVRIGYIADEVPSEFMVGNVIDQVSVNGLLLGAIKELNLEITPIKNLTRDGNFVTPLREFFADAANNVSDFFANKVHTKTICLSDDSGNETCLSKSDIDALVESSQSSQTSSTSVSGDQTGSDDSSSSVVVDSGTPASDDNSATSSEDNTSSDISGVDTESGGQ